MNATIQWPGVVSCIPFPCSVISSVTERSNNAMSAEEQAIVRMIGDRVSSHGHSIAQIARTTGISPGYLARLARAAGIRYRNQRASPEQIRRAIACVIRDGLTFRAAAKKHGMSKTSVHRFVQHRRNKKIDAAGPIKFQERTSVCPVHGRVSVWPCVACAALNRPQTGQTQSITQGTSHRGAGQYRHE